MHNQSQGYLHWDIKAGTATLNLANPPLNVLHMPMLYQLESALADLSQDESIRVLVLRTEGRYFSAGVDVADHTEEKVGEMIPLFDRTCNLLADFPVPTIAVVQGHALGGGCELVLCCDLAVMSDEARIGQPEIKLAALAPVAAYRLPDLVGYRTAADMLLTGRLLESQEALALGLVNAVVPLEQINDWVEQTAGQLAKLSRAALTLAKRTLRSGYARKANAQAEIERIYLEELMNTADAKEGLAAFLEKRPPVWTHR